MSSDILKKKDVFICYHRNTLDFHTQKILIRVIIIFQPKVRNEAKSIASQASNSKYNYISTFFKH